MNVFKTDGKYHQLKIDNNQSKSKKKKILQQLRVCVKKNQSMCTMLF